MPPDDGNIESADWPVPNFQFEIDLGAGLNAISFLEVRGLDAENQIIEYRKNNSPVFSTVKMPGLAKSGNVTLKKGVFINDNRFWDWHEQIKANTIARRMVTIKLLDENDTVVMQWQLENAWPTKITTSDMKSDGNEIAVETIEIAHERLTIKNG